jgi:hypothetical protein
MATPQTALRFGLPATLSQYNGHKDVVGPYDASTKTCVVSFPKDIKISDPRKYMFLPEDIAPTFVQRLSDLQPLTAGTAIQTGPHDRKVVATVAIRTGTMFKIPVVEVCMTSVEIAEVERRIKRFAQENLKELMGLPPDFDQTIVFETNYSDYKVLVRAFVNVMHHPVLQELMHFDFFGDAFLTQLWGRCESQFLVWFKFWIAELAGEVSPTDVCRVLTFLSVWVYPHLTPEQKHGKLLFGTKLSLFPCPNDCWEFYLNVMTGRQNVSEDSFTGRHLSMDTWDLDSEGHLKLFMIHDVTVVGKIVMDYDPKYSSGPRNSLIKVERMPLGEKLTWIKLYMN